MAVSGNRALGARVRLVEMLIAAVSGGGKRLAQVRSQFAALDPSRELRRLRLCAVDPELLEAALGPELAPAWVVPLRAQYARCQEAYPADWFDVEKVWREQRGRWRKSSASSASSAFGALARSYPERSDSPGAGRAAGSREPRRGARAASAPSASPAPVIHRPTPAGAAPVVGDGEEAIVAPPGPVSGAMSEDALDALQEEEPSPDGGNGASSRARRSASPRRAEDAGPGSRPGGNGAAPARSVPQVSGSGCASASRRPSAAARAVSPGRAGELVERLVQAMLQSRAQVDSVRRVWVDADGLQGGWDLWALDPLVLDRVRSLDRGPHR